MLSFALRNYREGPRRLQPGSSSDSAVRDRWTMSRLKSGMATFFVIFFFAVFSINVDSRLVPFAVLAIFPLYLVIYHRELYYFLTTNSIVVLYPSVVLLSATWSLVPSKSLWYAIQFLVTFCAGILIGVSTTPRQLVRGIFVAMAVVIIASLVWGRTGVSAVAFVLIGVTGGKTAMGYAAVTLVGSGLAVLFDRRQPLVYRLAALALIPVGAYIATHIEAASAVVLLGAIPLAFFGFLALRYLTVGGRFALVAVMLVITVPLAAVVYSEFFRDADERILRALNKDVTLTGRTVMWAKADEWIKDAPEIGHGYRAFWVSDNSDSIGILHKHGLTDARVFQLHHTVREILVDTGLLGLVALSGAALVFLFYVMAFAFLNPGPASAFVATMYLALLARTTIETLIGIFYPGTILFYACGTAAIVFFMNRANQLSDRPAPDSNRSGQVGRFRSSLRQGRNGRQTLSQGRPHRLA